MAAALRERAPGIILRRRSRGRAGKARLLYPERCSWEPWVVPLIVKKTSRRDNRNFPMILSIASINVCASLP